MTEENVWELAGEIYKSSVFQAFTNFDFNSTIRKKYNEFCNYLEISS